MTRAAAWASLALGCAGGAKDDDTAEVAAGAWYTGDLEVATLAVSCDGNDFAVAVTTRGWSSGVLWVITAPDATTEEHPLALEARDPDGWWERWTAHIAGGSAWAMPGRASVWSCGAIVGDELAFQAWALDPETGEVADCLALDGGESAPCSR